MCICGCVYIYIHICGYLVNKKNGVRKEILSSHLEWRLWGQEESFDSIRKRDFVCFTYPEMDPRENKGGSPNREDSHG